MMCYFHGLLACAARRATFNVPSDQCYERVLVQVFWVLHCLSQVSEYMRTIATLPLVTASLILGRQKLHVLLAAILASVEFPPAPLSPPRRAVGEAHRMQGGRRRDQGLR
jgi:hypothetical protein